MALLLLLSACITIREIPVEGVEEQETGPAPEIPPLEELIPRDAEEPAEAEEAEIPETENAVISTEGQQFLDFFIHQGDKFLLQIDGTVKVLQYHGRSKTRNELQFSDSTGNSYTADYAVIKKPLNQPQESTIIIVADETGKGEIIAGGQHFKLMTDSNLKLQIEKEGAREIFYSYIDFVTAYALGKGTLKMSGKEFLFFVSKDAGNPIAMDLDGDGRVEGDRVG